ncbi:MAG: TfoX/Sxy family protein [Burkholderiales bacterium]
MKHVRHDDFVEYVCERLAPLGEVRPKRMFGGWGIYVDETFMAIVAFDTLWFKVDDGNRADYEALGARAFKPFADRDTVMSYREVPAEVIDDRLRLVDWARRAIDAAQRSASRKAPPRRTVGASRRKTPR